MSDRRTKWLIAAAIVGGPLLGCTGLFLWQYQQYVNWHCRTFSVSGKAVLLEIHAKEKAFHAANGRYSTDLERIGWKPGVRRYVAGFANPSAPAGDPEEDPHRRASTLVDEDADFYAASIGDLPQDTFATASHFRAAAVADLDHSDAGLDVWVVDETGAVTHRTDDCDFSWAKSLTGQ